MVKSQGLDSFARFYKKYLNVWSVAAAALPVPVTSLRIIPMYAAQRQFLSWRRSDPRWSPLAPA